VSSPVQDAYARGVLDGRVAIRLDHHDDQIAAMNTLLERTVDIAASQAATVQTLTEARVTDAATRVATADAVKEAKIAQEAQAQSAWSPMSKLIAIVGAVGVVFGINPGAPSRTLLARLEYEFF